MQEFKKNLLKQLYILYVIMKLELLLQSEITIKAQLNKMYGCMIMKEIYVFFLKKILYL